MIHIIEKKFHDSVRKNVLSSNFHLDCFHLTVLDKSCLKKIVSERDYLISIIKKHAKNNDEIHLPADYDFPFLDRYESGFLGSIAFALWFMEFDEDNWFSFDSIHQETSDFLDDRLYDERIELYLLKGLESSVEQDALLVTDTPLTVNYETGCVSLWQGYLQD